MKKRIMALALVAALVVNLVSLSMACVSAATVTETEENVVAEAENQDILEPVETDAENIEAEVPTDEIISENVDVVPAAAEETQVPEETEIPVETEIPAETVSPAETEIPEETPIPESTEEPVETEIPDATPVPVETEDPSTNVVVDENVKYALNEASGKLTISCVEDSESYLFFIRGINSLFSWQQISSIKSIDIEDGITDISYGAFNNLENLSEITLPDSLISIGDRAFSYCTNLTSIKIPGNVTIIGNAIFDNCIKLKEIEVDASNAKYASDQGVLFDKEMTELIAFPCGKEGAYHIPDSVTSIASNAFYLCSGLTSIEIPEKLNHIGDYVFYECKNLKDVKLPGSITSIGNYAFCNCSTLTGIELPDSITSIGYSAFHGCDSLTNIRIPSGITSINFDTFGFCSNLSSVTFNVGLKTIESYAFENCINLHTIKLPDGIENIGRGAFWGCLALTNVYIPESVTDIAYGVFKDCTSLASVAVPEKVVSIGETSLGYAANGEKKADYVIYGFINSQAQAYATSNGFQFVAIQKYTYNDEGNYYEFTIVPESSNTSYTIGSGGSIVIYCTGRLQDFVRLLIDGKVVDPSYYSLADGSTILTLNSAFLDTLAPGDHTAALEYTNGIAQTTITILQNTSNGGNGGNSGSNGSGRAAGTGDHSAIALWLSLFVISGMTASYLFISLKRRKA